MAKFGQNHRRQLMLLSLVLILSACTSHSNERIPTQPPIDLIPAESSTPTNDTYPSQPLSLFLNHAPPINLFKPEAFINFTLGEDLETSSLWLGERESTPDGEILASSTWVYALAAPFPTLTDDIGSSDLREFWQGKRGGNFSQVSLLYAPEILKTVLDSRWGKHDPSIVKFYETSPKPNELWDENSWIILPFESLLPKLKVISVDGISPLFMNFDSVAYALTVNYDLILMDGIAISPSDRQTLANTLQTTNRDKDKMTTLVMTGVTALVRATAYRMETKGLTYPGEEIVDWLSEADLTHISNEVSFFEECPFPDPNSRLLFFCSNPDYIELFDFVGADIIELTGNHNNDSWYVYGKDVVPFSLDLYQEHGMKYFGGGLNIEEAMTPLLITHNGNQLAFIGCNASGPDYAWATEEHSGSAPCGDYQWMADEISRLSVQGYLPIATFQYFEDYYNFPGEHHIRDFGLMAEAGAVLVNGSQAHRPKGMAFVQDAFIDYGLGNLFFDQMGIIDDYGNQITQTRWEIIQRHTVYDGQLLSTELLTAILEDYAQPRPMTTSERHTFLEELFTASGWISR